MNARSSSSSSFFSFLAALRGFTLPPRSEKDFFFSLALLVYELRVEDDKKKVREREKKVVVVL
jgi:hypothetical protein